jgi:hypothetical protein
MTASAHLGLFPHRSPARPTWTGPAANNPRRCSAATPTTHQHSYTFQQSGSASLVYLISRCGLQAAAIWRLPERKLLTALFFFRYSQGLTLAGGGARERAGCFGDQADGPAHRPASRQRRAARVLLHSLVAAPLWQPGEFALSGGPVPIAQVDGLFSAQHLRARSLPQLGVLPTRCNGPRDLLRPCVSPGRKCMESYQRIWSSD